MRWKLIVLFFVYFLLFIVHVSARCSHTTIPCPSPQPPPKKSILSETDWAPVRPQQPYSMAVPLSKKSVLSDQNWSHVRLFRNAEDPASESHRMDSH